MKVCNHYQHQHPPSSACIIHRSTCIIHHAAFSMHHSACIIQHPSLLFRIFDWIFISWPLSTLSCHILVQGDLNLLFLFIEGLLGKNESTLCLFNLAMENGPPIDDKHDDLPIKMVISHSYVSHNQRVNININWLVVYPTSVGMMKFPTEWKVIKFMFETTSQIRYSQMHGYDDSNRILLKPTATPRKPKTQILPPLQKSTSKI